MWRKHGAATKRTRTFRQGSLGEGAVAKRSDATEGVLLKPLLLQKLLPSPIRVPPRCLRSKLDVVAMRQRRVCYANIAVAREYVTEGVFAKVKV